MTPDVVVDIGNTRLKWGRCEDGRIVAMAGLHADESHWASQLELWHIAPKSKWLLASVHPQRCEHLAQWLRQRSMQVAILSDTKALPLEVRVDQPENVGIDRLLNAVGAKSQMSEGRGAIIVDGGTAITVDVLDGEGVFLGGAIMPGLRLMAASLREHTAKLPLVDVRELIAPEPGRNTHDAIAVGICWAIIGGIRELIEEFNHDPSQTPHVFLTGGDAEFLRPVHPDAVVWPDLTLEGILGSAGAIP